MTEIATLGGGCFWCLEAVFERVQGISAVVPGYAGGSVPNPTYDQVCSGTTGHAEVVQLTFDPSTITFREILEIFFAMHDPTTPNRQGGDVGSQYRSVIFAHSPEQHAEANEVIAALETDEIWPDPVVTEITEATEFFPSEDYHREYYRRNRNQPYCQVVISPKVTKLRERFANRLRSPSTTP
jgi:peptide-methionine (S)-S-oxide reductase